MGANSLNILNYLDSVYYVVGRKALNSLFFLLLSSPSFFKFSQHPNVFINLNLNGIHRSGLSLLRGRGSNLQHLYIMGYVIYLRREDIYFIYFLFHTLVEGFLGSDKVFKHSL